MSRLSEARVALAPTFGDAPSILGSEGELVRAALDLLAQDPPYTDYTTIAVTDAALLVLQTHIKFERDQDGKWSIEIQKKSASDDVHRHAP